MALISPVLNEPQIDQNGDPLAGGTINTYVAGSTTPLATYTDSGGLTPQTNPIVLNASGACDNPIWLTAGRQYKFILKDSSGVTIRTYDNISGVNDVSVTASEWQASGFTPTYISATSFSVAGDQTATYQTGRRLQSTVTAGTAYSSVVSAAFSAGITTVTVSNDSTPLDSGLSAVSYGLLTPTNPSIPVTVLNDIGLCEFRMTLTSGLPVTAADVTAATTMYVTPCQGNRIALYNGSTGWVIRSSAEMSIAVPASTSQMYDLFCYDNSGTPTLEALAWTNDTTRATALALQNGVYVKSGAPTRRYLGSFRTTAVSGQTEDSTAKRYVWNYYNRRARSMSRAESTASWTYTTATNRQANNNAANQLDFVIGVAEEAVRADLTTAALNTSGGLPLMSAIGLDSTTTVSGSCRFSGVDTIANTTVNMKASFTSIVDAGRHTLVWLERSFASGTTTWYGANTNQTASGMTGEVRG